MNEVKNVYRVRTESNEKFYVVAANISTAESLFEIHHPEETIKAVTICMKDIIY